MEFKEIDRDHWDRDDVFRLYTELWAPVSYSWMENVDITETLRLKKEMGFRLTPFVYFVVTRSLNEQENFRIAYKHEKLGIMSEIAPLFPVPSSTGPISFRFVNNLSDYASFYADYQVQTALKSDKALPDNLKRNFYVISDNPFSSPESFSLTIHDAKHYFIPTIILFKIVEKEGRFYLPVSISVSHAVCDGKNVARFFESLRSRFSHPEKEME